MVQGMKERLRISDLQVGCEKNVRLRGMIYSSLSLSLSLSLSCLGSKYIAQILQISVSDQLYFIQNQLYFPKFLVINCLAASS